MDRIYLVDYIDLIEKENWEKKMQIVCRMCFFSMNEAEIAKRDQQSGSSIRDGYLMYFIFKFEIKSCHHQSWPLHQNHRLPYVLASRIQNF
jgi:hypothetical protein